MTASKGTHEKHVNILEHLLNASLMREIPVLRLLYPICIMIAVYRCKLFSIETSFLFFSVFV